MARKVNYTKKVEKIKAQLDELVEGIENDRNNPVVEDVQKTKISDIDFENESLESLIKIQSRLVREINRKFKE